MAWNNRELTPPADYATMPIEEAFAWWAKNCPGHEYDSCTACSYYGGVGGCCGHELHPRRRKGGNHGTAQP